MPLLLAAPDKFRGTATAADVAAAMVRAAVENGWEATAVAISDGGEGLLDCLGGATRSTRVTGPLGDAVDAAWRCDGDRAVIEMARASGIGLVPANEPLRAGTRGTGELIAAALEAGVAEIIVGVGGSASTDGGLGAVEVLRSRGDLTNVVVAADVTTTFVDAAAVFGPQKGASAGDVVALTERLSRLVDTYRAEFGRDVSALPGSGAAGGLAGGLAALGARIVPGFEFVADAVGLDGLIGAADLVITGEGSFDATSRLGKATGSVLARCRDAGTASAVVAGRVAVAPGVPTVDLSGRYGERAARTNTVGCVRAGTAHLLATTPNP